MAKREVDLGPIIDMESIWIRFKELITEKINEMMEEYGMAGITSEQLEETKAQIIESVRTMLGEYWQQIEQFRIQDMNDRERQRLEDWQRVEQFRMQDEQDREMRKVEYWIDIQEVVKDNVAAALQEPMGELNDILKENANELRQSMEDVVAGALVTFNMNTLHQQFSDVRDAISSAIDYPSSLLEGIKDQLSDIQARLE